MICAFQPTLPGIDWSEYVIDTPEDEWDFYRDMYFNYRDYPGPY